MLKQLTITVILLAITIIGCHDLESYDELGAEVNTPGTVTYPAGAVNVISGSTSMGNLGTELLSENHETIVSIPISTSSQTEVAGVSVDVVKYDRIQAIRVGLIVADENGVTLEYSSASATELGAHTLNVDVGGLLPFSSVGGRSLFLMVHFERLGDRLVRYRVTYAEPGSTTPPEEPVTATDAGPDNQPVESTDALSSWEWGTQAKIPGHGNVWK